MGWFRRRKRQEDAEDTKRLVQHAAELHGVPTEEVIKTVFNEDDEADLDEAELEDELRRGKAGKWVTLVIIGLVFGLGIVALMKLASMADKTGPVAASGLQQVQQSLAPTPTPGALPTLTGQYIEFSYPSVFDSVRSMANLPTTAERYEIGSKGDYRRLISVMVENNTPTYTNDSGYAYRKLNPQLYKPVPTTVAKEPAMIMVKTDGTERTLYWEHADKMVVISVTDTNPQDDITAYLDTISKTLRWSAL